MSLPELAPGGRIDEGAIAAWLAGVVPAADLAATPQDEAFHAEGAVWTHTKLALEALAGSPAYAAADPAARPILAAAVLLHDVGKPATTRIEAGKLTSRGHSARGDNLARALWRRGVPFPIREHVCALIRHHQVPFYGITRPAADGARLAIRLSLLLRNDWLTAVADADARGRRCADPTDQARIVEHCALWAEHCRELGVLAAPRRFPSPHTRRIWLESDPGARDPDVPAYEDTAGEAGHRTRLQDGHGAQDGARLLPDDHQQPSRAGRRPLGDSFVSQRWKPCRDYRVPGAPDRLCFDRALRGIAPGRRPHCGAPCFCCQQLLCKPLVQLASFINACCRAYRVLCRSIPQGAWSPYTSFRLLVRKLEMELLANLSLGLSTALTVVNLLYCLGGVCLGNLIGVLPGLGPTATIAMLLPITFTLPPVSALIMLSGIYYGSQYGGPLIQGLIKEVVGLHKNSMPKGIQFGERFEEKVRPVQVAGDPGGPGIYKFILPSGEVRRGVNPPFEESDLSKVNREGVRKKFEKTDVKLVEYREGIVRGAQTGKRELWPFLLGFVLVVLAVEMGVANGSPWKGKK